MISPGPGDQELAWRGYALNSLVLSLAFFSVPFFCLNVVFWIQGLDDGSTAAAALAAFFIYTGLFWVSKKKSIPLAILLLSVFTVVLSFFLSFGWGVGDITVSAVYAAAIMITSLLLQDKNFIFVSSTLLVGYVSISQAELHGWFAPPFHTALSANHLTLSFFLLILSFFGYITARLFDNVLAAQIAEVTRRQKLESRTRIAIEVQLSMLPTAPPSYAHLDIAGQSIPAREVGGDFFNYHQANSDELVVIIGDATGKGIPAALLMAVTTGIFDSLATQFTQPAVLLKAMTGHLYKHSRRNGLNIACLVAFFQGCRLCVANAGCVEPVIRRKDGRVEWLPAGGLPLGLEVSLNLEPWEQVYTDLAVGDMVILITDGIVETKNKAGRMLSFEQLGAIIATGPTHSARAMKYHILDRVEAYRGPQEQEDDVTLVVVRVKEVSGYVTETFH